MLRAKYTTSAAFPCSRSRVRKRSRSDGFAAGGWVEPVDAQRGRGRERDAERARRAEATGEARGRATRNADDARGIDAGEGRDASVRARRMFRRQASREASLSTCADVFGVARL